MMTRPQLIFADEPTGNLESRSATEMLELSRVAVDSFGQTLVMVTHDARAASYADRVVFLADGRIVDDLAAPTAEGVLERMAHLDARNAAYFGLNTHNPADLYDDLCVVPDQAGGSL